MTQTIPPQVGLNAEGLHVLSSVAEAEGRTYDEYIEEGLMVLLGIGDVLLENRAAGKVDTRLVYEAEDGTFFRGEDIEGLLRENERGLPIAATTGFGVLDPFKSDDCEQTELPIHPVLRDEVVDMGERLGFGLKAMVQMGIDLRRQLQVSGTDGVGVYLEMADPQDLAILPTSFVD